MAVKCAKGCYRPKPFYPRKVVTLQRINPSATTTDLDEQELSKDANWLTLGTRQAEVKPRGGTERFSSDAIQAGLTVTVRVRRDPLTKALAPVDRLQIDGKPAGIFSVSEEDGMPYFIIIDCVEPK